MADTDIGRAPEDVRIEHSNINVLIGMVAPRLLMLSLGLELGFPLSCCVSNLGNDCKGPRSIARVLYAGESGKVFLRIIPISNILYLLMN